MRTTYGLAAFLLLFSGCGDKHETSVTPNAHRTPEVRVMDGEPCGHLAIEVSQIRVEAALGETHGNDGYWVTLQLNSTPKIPFGMWFFTLEPSEHPNASRSSYEGSEPQQFEVVTIRLARNQRHTIDLRIARDEGRDILTPNAVYVACRRAHSCPIVKRIEIDLRGFQ